MRNLGETETQFSNIYSCMPQDFLVRKGKSGQPQLYFASPARTEILLGSPVDFLLTKVNKAPGPNGEVFSLIVGNRKYIFGDPRLANTGNGKEPVLHLSESSYKKSCLAIAQQLHACRQEIAEAQEITEVADNQVIAKERMGSLRRKVRILTEVALLGVRNWLRDMSTTSFESLKEVREYAEKLQKLEDQRINDELEAATFIDPDAFVRETERRALLTEDGEKIHVILSETKFQYPHKLGPKARAIITNQPDLVVAALRAEEQLEHVFVIYSPFAQEPIDVPLDIFGNLEKAGPILKQNNALIEINTDYRAPRAYSIKIELNYSNPKSNTLNRDALLEPTDPIALQTAVLAKLQQLKEIIHEEYTSGITEETVEYKNKREHALRLQVLLVVSSALMLFVAGTSNLHPEDIRLLVYSLSATLSVTPSLEVYKQIIKKKIGIKSRRNVQKIDEWRRASNLMRLLATIAERVALKTSKTDTAQSRAEIAYLAEAQERQFRLAHNEWPADDATVTSARTNLTNSNQGAN